MTNYFDNFKEASQFAKEQTKKSKDIYSVKREENRWRVWSDAAEARERKKARHEKQQIEEGIRYMASLAEDGSDPLWSENESIDANWDEEPRIQEYPFEFDVTTPSHYDDGMD